MLISGFDELSSRWAGPMRQAVQARETEVEANPKHEGPRTKAGEMGNRGVVEGRGIQVAGSGSARVPGRIELEFQIARSRNGVGPVGRDIPEPE